LTAVSPLTVDPSGPVTVIALPERDTDCENAMLTCAGADETVLSGAGFDATNAACAVIGGGLKETSPTRATMTAIAVWSMNLGMRLL
jgi:hypothetical protein